jgi:hypothetical protein
MSRVSVERELPPNPVGHKNKDPRLKYKDDEDSGGGKNR